MNMCRTGILLAIVLSAALQLSAQEIDFNRDVRPILSNNCFQCHGPDEAARQADLRLDTAAGIAELRDPELIVKGDITQGEFLHRIMTADTDLKMPPPESNRELSEQQLSTLKRWVEQGAEYSIHWSFTSPEKSALPQTINTAWARNAIDHFILSRLQQEGLQPSDEASRRTLIRRLTFDLTGLPPTPDEVVAFLADNSADAYENVVSRLLESSRFGEHMAWTWLEAARYSDTNGYQGDRTRSSYFWRTWVIEAFNRNMPFDQFSLEQIAGDLLESPSTSQLIATGFNRNHPLNGEGGRIAEENRVEYVFDRTETTSTVWLGLTVGCARCHDHKYDPISQREYYEMYAYFNSIDESGRVDAGGNAQPIIKVPTLKQRSRVEELELLIAELDKERSQPLGELKESRQQWIAKWNSVINGSDTNAFWRPLIPKKAESREGATTHIEPHGKVVITGKFPDFDDYTLTIPVSPGRIEAIRLEALTNETIQFRGPGRNANFVLTGFEVALHSKDGEVTPIKIHDATADFVQGGFNIIDTLDPANKGGWAVWDGELNTAVDRQAIFTLEQPLEIGPEATLIVTMKHRSDHAKHILSTFALSTSSTREVTFETDTIPPADIVELLQIAGGKWNEQQAVTVGNFHRRSTQRHRNATAKLRLAQTEHDRLNEGFQDTMVMRDRETPRDTRILIVGRYDNPLNDENLFPDTIASVSVMPEDAPKNRLGLARWIVSTDNPLTSRVTVNRFWQQFFGTGLVKTTEDFGSQGELPSHPQLLDWLAVDFQENNWDIKRLITQFVTSSTYRQSSSVTPELLEKDPYNRLLGRAPRYRLAAHTIRDNALAVSGLLTEKLGGPSVKPYQPPGLWADFSFGKIKYSQDSGDALYRRSLYTFWRRSLSPPNMFDEASRQTCEVRTKRTNTPLQALTLLNDITFVEAARVFAQSLLLEHQQDADRLHHAFQRALSRPPTEAEIKLMNNILILSRTHYLEKPEEAIELLSVGESKPDESISAVDLAAFTNLANIIFNTDEFISKE
ncbi:MAG: chromosome segregation protein [Planctomycetaceae bacterium]|nr:chromosome segregation protein [Planctomycetaceae bacterium]